MLNADFGRNMEPGAQATTFFRAEVPDNETTGLQINFRFVTEPLQVTP